MKLIFLLITLIFNLTQSVFATESLTFKDGAKAFQLGDDRTALSIFEKICSSDDTDSGMSCAASGVIYETSDTERDYMKAVNQYNEACVKQSVYGCFNAGNMYAEGIGVEQDYSKAIPYFQRSCDLCDGKACTIIGLFFENGKGISKNTKMALKLFEVACNLGDEEGCGHYKRLKK